MTVTIVLRLAAGLLALAGWSVNSLAQTLTPGAGTVEVLTLRSHIFNNTRSIRIVLPPHYYEAAERHRKYPVFYFTDGVAVFHARELVTVAEKLINSGQIQPIIFVGIDNGGSARESKNPGLDRANEYLPFEDKFLQPPLPSPQGRLFPKFFENEVRPFIERRYRVTDKIGLGGSSYGAEIALYTAMEQPGRYRWLYLESPSLYVHDDELLRRAENFHHWPEHIYIGAGTAEGAKEDEQEMVDDVQRLLKSIGGQSKTCLLIVPGAHHEEGAWRERLPAALKFMLGNGGCDLGHN